MNEFNLIKVEAGKLSDVANKLVDKVSDVVGGIARPYQIKRVAEAESQAELIRANTRVQVSEIQMRALERMVREEGQKQENIENITRRAIPHLEEQAKPDQIETDWIAHFFDRCRLISDGQMQELWSSILGNEANRPGSFSKKTIDTVATLEKSDAELFSNLCSFVWECGGPFAFVMDFHDPVYSAKGIHFEALEHLDSIGLISLGRVAGYTTGSEMESLDLFYCGREIALALPTKMKLQLGRVLLTRTGRELYPVCAPHGSQEFLDYMISRWINEGILVSVPVKSRTSWQCERWDVRRL